MKIHQYTFFAVIGLAIALVLSACGQKPAASTLLPANASPPSPVSYDVLAGTVKRNIIYNTVDNTSLQLDIYFPKVMNGKAPAVLYVHGGAWISGDKDIGAGSQDVAALTGAGFIVVPVNYRLAPNFEFPAMIEDVKSAVRFLRANAAEYGINADKIGAYGGSAGGHLVSLMGLADRSAGWDVGPYTTFSSQVQAVIDMFGPSDLPALFSRGQISITQSVFGTSNVTSPALIKTSPVTWVNPGDPPFLILQGDKDMTVPLSQSQELYDRLTGSGVEATLVVFKNGTHGLNGSPDMQPTRQELTQILVQFFQKHLL